MRRSNKSTHHNPSTQHHYHTSATATAGVFMDLKLAETYIPICLSLLKCTCLVCVQYSLHVSTHTGYKGHPICIMLLLVDRILTNPIAEEVPTMIMDSNALCWVILCAYIILLPTSINATSEIRYFYVRGAARRVSRTLINCIAGIFTFLNLQGVQIQDSHQSNSCFLCSFLSLEHALQQLVWFGGPPTLRIPSCSGSEN